MILTKEWLKAALIRATKTFFQTAVATLPAVATISEVNWGTVFSTSFFAFALSVFTSLAGLPEVKEESE